MKTSTTLRNASILLALGTMGQECPDPIPDPGTGPSVPVCGDGFLEGDEACDDGNLALGDGCSDTCEITALCLEDLGPARPWNVMSWGSVVGSPDAEGKVATGDVLDLSAFSIGFRDQGGVAAVARQLELTNGMVWGDAVYDDGANLLGVGFGAGGSLVNDTPIDWTQAEIQLKAFSLHLFTTLAPTGTVDAVPTGPSSANLFLRGTDTDRNVFTLTAADLSAATGLTYDVPAGSEVIVHVVGSPVVAADFDFFPGSFDEGDVLWNFVDATDLQLARIGWAGTILAPYADLEFVSGQLDGQTIVASVDGRGEFHWVPFTGTFECGAVCGDGNLDPGESCDDGNTVSGDGCSETCDVETVCIEDFGVATPFNAFVFDDFTGVPDVEGKVAAGDEVEMTNFSVGFKDQGGQALVAGDLTLANGMVYGDAVHSGTATTSSVGFLPGYSLVNGAPIDFAAAQVDLTSLSGFYASLPVTGTTTVTPIPDGVLIDLVGVEPGLNVFEIDAASLSASRSLSITVPDGATVLVNLTGTSFGPADFDFFYEGVDARGVLYNAYQAVAWDMARLGWRGSLLAPYADVVFNNGQMDGQIIAHSVSGRGEYHWVPFVGLPCP